jgi:hypothetical protein
MRSPKPPPPPDPKETSAAQTGTNVATSIANANLQNVNRVGADGSILNYDVTGNYGFTDPYTGKTYDIPQYTATEKLSPEAQAIYNANQGAQRNYADTAEQQTGFLKDYLGTPWKADTADIESRLYDMGKNTLDRTFTDQSSDLETQLSNQGIKLGSDAYSRAKSDLADNQNAAYSNLALQGRDQAFKELLVQRNQPINETSALMTGSQVSMPNYGVNKPGAMATTDNAGLINQNYDWNLNSWQNQQAQKQAMMGGVLGLGAKAISGGIF